MPKAKPTPKRKTPPKPIRRAAAQAKYSEEYLEYLERYEMSGEGKPRLSPAEFDRLDDELLDLLALEYEQGLSDEQIVRLHELEYLLLDAEP